MADLVFFLDTNKPLYSQVYSNCIKAIQDGSLKENEKMPSIREFALRLNISRNTIEAAYNQLVSEGYIESRPKSGYYVCHIDNYFNNSKVTATQNDETLHNYIEEKTINLSSNNIDESLFPFSTLKKLYKEVLSKTNHQNFLRSGDFNGDYQFRKAISKYLTEARGVNCSPQNIFIGAGTDYLLQIAVRLISKTLNQDTNTYGIENPCYEKTKKILKDCHQTILDIPLDEYGLSISELTKTNAQVIYVTPSHQYPSGITMPIQRRTELLNWASKNQSFIIEDDYDSDYRYDGRPIPALQGLDKNEVVLYLGTFSTTLAPSMRVGYLVIPNRLLNTFKTNFSFYTCTVSRIEQTVLTRFLSEGYFERHINRTRRLYHLRRDALISFLTQNIKDIKILGSEAGIHLIAEVSLIKAKSQDDFIEKARQNNIDIRLLPTKSIKKINLILGYSHTDFDSLKQLIDLL